MDDKIQIKLLNDAIRAYENGEIIEAKDMAIDFVNNITDFEAEDERIPSGPHTEIVRCKDCKHREAENGFCEGRGWPMQLVPDDGFCDKGERSSQK